MNKYRTGISVFIYLDYFKGNDLQSYETISVYSNKQGFYPHTPVSSNLEN